MFCYRWILRDRQDVEANIAKVLAPKGDVSRWLKERRPSVRVAIAHKDLQPGMTRDELIAARGEPHLWIAQQGSHGLEMVAWYPSQEAWIRNGRIVDLKPGRALQKSNSSKHLLPNELDIASMCKSSYQHYITLIRIGVTLIELSPVCSEALGSHVLVLESFVTTTVKAENIAPESLLTSYQVGSLLQVNPSSVNKWVKDGRIPAFRTPGGHRRIRAADLVLFLQEHSMPVPKILNNAAKKRLLIVDDDPNSSRL